MTRKWMLVKPFDASAFVHKVQQMVGVDDPAPPA